MSDSSDDGPDFNIGTRLSQCADDGEEEEEEEELQRMGPLRNRKCVGVARLARRSSRGKSGGDDDEATSRADQPEAEALGVYQRTLVQMAGLIFGVGVPLPPVMLILYLLMRRLRERDYEAGIYAVE